MTDISKGHYWEFLPPSIAASENGTDVDNQQGMEQELHLQPVFGRFSLGHCHSVFLEAPDR